MPTAKTDSSDHSDTASREDRLRTPRRDRSRSRDRDFPTAAARAAASITLPVEDPRAEDLYGRAERVVFASVETNERALNHLRRRIDALEERHSALHSAWISRSGDLEARVTVLADRVEFLLTCLEDLTDGLRTNLPRALGYERPYTEPLPQALHSAYRTIHSARGHP